MKKICFLATVLFSFLSLFAQDPKFGVKAGLNLATVTGSGGEMKPGFSGGFLAHVHVTPAFSLQPELIYSNQGTKYNDNDKLRLNYINLPVLLQYNFDNGFRLQGGPQVGFLLDAKRKVNDVEIDQSDSYKSIDFSIPLGVSYLGYSGFGFDGRYNLGISKLLKNSSANVRNSVLHFGLFYLFDHRHKARSK